MCREAAKAAALAPASRLSLRLWSCAIFWLSTSSARQIKSAELAPTLSLIANIAEYPARIGRVFTVHTVVLTRPTEGRRRLFSIPPGSSVRAGRHAGCPAECAIETGLRREPAAKGNIAQGLLAGCKQRHRALQPLSAHISMRC